MDPPPPMILPKGILVNTKGIYQEIAEYPEVPSQKLWEYWRVYTTTHKELQDPTARRLENFWWQVWGSNRRHLSGRTLALLYENISLGPTFVPLRGPPNRWEGPDVPPTVRQILEDLRNRETHTGQQNEDKDSETETKPIRQIPSASRPPPPHPILKKPRGSSSTGPRPTARFISPAGSPEDNGDIPSSGSTIVPALEMKAANVKSPSKKKTAGQKKFVVSSGGSKRRPILVRKTSSQSSYGSDGSSSKELTGSAGSRSPHSSARPVSPIIEGVVKPSSKVNEDEDEDDYEDEEDLQAPTVPSAKALGKRPIVTPKTTLGKKVHSKHSGKEVPPSEPKHTPATCPDPKGSEAEGDSTAVESVSPNTTLLPTKGAVLPPTHKVASLRQSQTSQTVSTSPSSAPAKERQNLSKPMSMINIPSLSRASTTAPALSSSIPEPRSLRVSSAGGPPSSSRPMLKSRSSSGYSGTNSGLFTNATASTSNIAAQGTIVDQSGVGSLPPSPFFDQHFGDSETSSSSSILDPRLAPTQPSTSEHVPLGRTRSQLTLLLEREKSRGNAKSRK